MRVGAKEKGAAGDPCRCGGRRAAGQIGTADDSGDRPGHRDGRGLRRRRGRGDRAALCGRCRAAGHPDAGRGRADRTARAARRPGAARGGDADHLRRPGVSDRGAARGRGRIPAEGLRSGATRTGRTDAGGGRERARSGGHTGGDRRLSDRRGPGVGGAGGQQADAAGVGGARPARRGSGQRPDSRADGARPQYGQGPCARPAGEVGRDQPHPGGHRRRPRRPGDGRSPGAW